MVKSFQDKANKYLFIYFDKEVFQAVCVDNTSMMGEDNFLPVLFPEGKNGSKSDVGIYPMNVDYIVLVEARFQIRKIGDDWIS